MVSELYFKPETKQIGMLLYNLGEGLYCTVKFPDEDNLEYKDLELIQNFDYFLKVKCNIVCI